MSKCFVVIWRGWESQGKPSQALLTGIAVVLQMLDRGVVQSIHYSLIRFPGLSSDMLVSNERIGFRKGGGFRRVSLLHAEALRLRDALKVGKVGIRQALVFRNRDLVIECGVGRCAGHTCGLI